MITQKIKTVVAGVGSLGQHHARILSKHPNSELVAVIDSDLKRAQKIANAYNTRALASVKELNFPVDAAVVAVPTPYHFEVADHFLERSIHCLVEKPFTTEVSQATELISKSIEKNLILQVGHIERFNPAVVAAIPYINSPRFAEVNRLGPYDPRTAHIGVILDLMIHDLDILTYIINDKVVSLEAYGASVLSKYEDIVKVRLKFSKGCVADLSASRVSLEKYRKIRIFQPDSYLSIDYAGKSLKVYKKRSEVVESLSDIEVIKPKLKDAEPLYQELDHFLTCVIQGKKPLVTGEHGRDAIELAHEIMKNLKRL
jgi:predicted dehydrogenase